jgi:hypothetical protein
MEVLVTHQQDTFNEEHKVTRNTYILNSTKTVIRGFLQVTV